MIFEAKLIRKEELYEDCICFEFLMSEDLELNYNLGQYLMAEVGDVRRRPYTIERSSMNKKQFVLLVDLTPNGIGSQYFKSLQLGMKTIFQGPFGIFNLDLNAKSYLFIATGVGIAPFTAMISKLIATMDTDAQIKLLQGASNQKQLINAEEFSNWQNEHQNFKWIPTLSQETSEGIYNGRVSNWIEEQYTPKSDELIYICGSPEMVRETRRALIQKGALSEQIKIEVFS